MRHLLAIILLATATSIAAQDKSKDKMPNTRPEPVMRAAIQAMLTGDSQGLEKYTLPNPQQSLLLARNPPVGDEQKILVDEIERVQFRQVQGYRLNGHFLQPNPANFPPGTTARFMAPVRGTLMVISVVKTVEGWKVDLRWWIELMALARRDSISKDSPEYVVKSFLLALLRLNKTEARKFVTSDTDINRVFADAPPYAEPSDQLPMLTIEMPLVEARPDESYPLPSGRVAQGSDRPEERKLLVGLFGPTEMVFEVVNVKNEWKVVGQSYFRQLNQ